MCTDKIKMQNIPSNVSFSESESHVRDEEKAEDLCFLSLFPKNALLWRRFTSSSSLSRSPSWDNPACMYVCGLIRLAYAMEHNCNIRISNK